MLVHNLHGCGRVVPVLYSTFHIHQAYRGTGACLYLVGV